MFQNLYFNWRFILVVCSPAGAVVGVMYALLAYMQVSRFPPYLIVELRHWLKAAHAIHHVGTVHRQDLSHSTFFLEFQRRGSDLK